MNERILITSADERTWPDHGPVLFLGDWCRLYERKVRWERLKGEVVPYHWDDRAKLLKDYHDLQVLYEHLLPKLSMKLNEIHGENHGLRYWRILVGPWLNQFIQIAFDRWEMIQLAAREYGPLRSRVIEGDVQRFVPLGMRDFSSVCVPKDAWNQAMCGYFLREGTNIPCEVLKISNDSLPDEVDRRPLRHGLARIISRLLAVGVVSNEAFFLADYLPFRQSLAVQLTMKQIPRFWRTLTPPKASISPDARVWRLEETGDTLFTRALGTLIPLQIPIAYLEGYALLKKKISELPWPRRPKLIFTSVSYNTGDVFKAWAAEKVEESGTPLVIGQHGGTFGMALFGSTEEHQLTISDAWLSWGWQNDDAKIKPVGNLKMVGRRVRWDPRGLALLVEMTIPRYSQYLNSIPVASQWLSYFEDQCRFVAALPERIRKQLLVRLFGNDSGWSQRERWRDRFPALRLDLGRSSMRALMKKTRLYISTYNATTFLESLALNIPTLIFWNPKFWELRQDARPYFEALKSVGIFHETPESAADKMSEIWDDVGAWWSTRPVREARVFFCERYSRMPKQPLKVLREALLSTKGGAR